MIFARALNRALERILLADPRVVLLGEDIADPYGGAFKVTRGLQKKYPKRVRTTPVSEAAIAGMSAGLALAGYRPIAEIMFGDFLTLTFDQVVNHISKYRAMYAEQAACPVILRSPSGGYRGYGPTHSQCLEKYFFGLPHFRVVAASVFHAPEVVLQGLLAQDDAALYVEHKRLYGRHMKLPHEGQQGDWLARPVGEDTWALSLVPPEECTVTVLAYGDMAAVGQAVLEGLGMEDEIFGELLVPATISPMDEASVVESVMRTGALVTVEEGTAGWSWGTEVAAQIGRHCFGRLRWPVEVVASRPTVIPSSRAKEQAMLVQPETIERAIRKVAS